jgi:predicted nucleic acid-binding protein
VSSVWVVNASPLISLARIGRLDLLEAPALVLNVPEAVVKEVFAGPPSDPARQALERGFGGLPTGTPIDLRVVEWGLGAGETAVLSHALLTGATAVLDDGRARAAARVLGVTVIGTLGVVINARRTQRIDSASTVLRALRDAGMRLDDATIAAALVRSVGEEWLP